MNYIYTHEKDAVFNRENCQMLVFSGGYAHQCRNKHTVTVEDVNYCRLHSPEGQKRLADERREAADLKLRIQRSRRNRESEQHQSRERMEKALREIAELTERQQLPLTAQIHALARTALAGGK